MVSNSRFVVLLRGINVGGKNRVPMAELRAGLTAAGFGDVSTYIQSGNVLLNAAAGSETKISTKVAATVQDEFGITVPVVVRPAEVWPAVMAANPFPQAAEEPKLLHVYFCDQAPDGQAVADFEAWQEGPEKFQAIGRELYVWYTEGASRSKLTGAVLERKLGVTTTARNWSTVLKLADLLGFDPG